MRRIYLDHNATTPPHPSVGAAMAAALDEGWGNPSSVHGPGRAARQLVERARAQVAALVGARPEEIVFTSGGTEGDHLAIRGAARAARAAGGRRTVVSSPLEHPAVRGSLAALADDGFRVAYAPVDGDGRIDPAGLAETLARLGGDVALCTLALANHELGNLYPVAELAALAHAAGALFHTDAVQAAGRVPVDVGALGVDLLTLSAHKIRGPKGVGALWQRRGVELAPLLPGGHQERERRPGTENVPGIVGFGVACDLARRELGDAAPRIARLRDRLERGALALDGARRFGDAAARVPGTSNIGFAGVEGELMMMGLDLEGVAVSTGAACTSGSIEPSPVILALGQPRDVAAQAVRFSLGADNTVEEVDEVLRLLPGIVARARGADDR
jgi:cysteine desulfurase